MRRELILGGAFVVAAQAALIFSMFVGSAFSDPGGAAGVAMVAAPTLVAAVLGAYAWWRPGPGAAIAVVVGVVAAVAAFANARMTGLPEWFGGYGHVIVVAAFVVIAAFAVRRPALGGGLLLVAAALVAIATPEIALFLAGPAVLAGVLFLVAGRAAGASQAPQVGSAG